MNTITRLLALFAIAGLPLAAHAQAPAGAQLLQPLLDRVAGNFGAGGVVAVEIEKGRVSYLTAGKPAPQPDVAPERIVFEIGSITKVFTALLLADAVNKGRCSLDDPIGEFLPEGLRMEPETAAITLAQLAAHTSGLPRLPTNFAPANPADPYADYDEQRLREFLGAFKAAKETPGTADYSNLGAGLLGHLLEQIHGKFYATLLTETITGPLGMHDTVIELDAGQQARFATPYSGTQPVSPWNFRALAGAGAIRSTAADMAVFAQALLSPDSAIAAAWNLVRQPRAGLRGSAGRIGLGIFIASADGRTIYNHSGGTGGFRSYLEIDPERQRALVILIDNDAVEPAGIAAALANPPPAQAATRDEVPIAATELAAYTGVYEIDRQARFTVVVDGEGRLRVRLTGQPFFPAFHSGNDRFFLKIVAAEFQFGRNAGGTIDSLTLFQNGRQIAAKKTRAPAPRILFPSEQELAAYVGRYQLAPGSVFEITQRGGVLMAKLTGQPAFPVHNDAPDHFVYDVVEASLTFKRDKTGAVTALVLHQNGMSPRAERIP